MAAAEPITVVIVDDAGERALRVDEVDPALLRGVSVGDVLLEEGIDYVVGVTSLADAAGKALLAAHLLTREGTSLTFAGAGQEE